MNILLKAERRRRKSTRENSENSAQQHPGRNHAGMCVYSDEIQPLYESGDEVRSKLKTHPHQNANATHDRTNIELL